MQLFDLPCNIREALSSNHHIFIKKFEYRNSFFIFQTLLNIRNYRNPAQRLFRYLVFNIKGSDRINLITKKVNPVRVFVRKRKNVDYRSPERILPRLINKLNPLKAIFIQYFIDKRDGKFIAFSDVKSIIIKSRSRNHLFHDCFGIGNDKIASFVESKFVQDFSAKYNILTINSLVNNTAAVG